MSKRDNNLLILECPHCRDCYDVKQWNKELKNSILLGKVDDFIPENITTDEWEEYAFKYSGLVDCPSCGEVCCFEDMIPV